MIQMKIEALSSSISVPFPKKEEPKSEVNYDENELAHVLAGKVFLFCYCILLYCYETKNI